MTAPAGELRPGLRDVVTVPALSWALYDFANTIFSYAVITRYFNDWLVIQRDEPDWYVGAMNAVVSLALVAALPFLGALGDRSGRRLPLLASFTALCVAATAVLGLVDTTLAALALAGVAIFAFSSALAQYDPLLADVAPPETRGRVSGLGVGMGYVGVLVALVVLGPLVPEGENQRAFLPTALLFAVFSLPCFLFVRERRAAASAALGGVARAAVAQLRSSLGHARAHAPVGRFLLARFFYADALATVIVFMTVYARRIADLPDSRIDALLGLSVVFAAVGAFVGGWLVERYGPKRVLRGILGVFAATAVLQAVSGSAALLWLVGPAVGIALGMVWSSDRVFMLRLSAPELRGELFGLYNLVGKLSSGFGPLVLWSATLWLLSDRTAAMSEAGASRVAVVLLAASTLVGLTLLRPLSDEDRWRA